MESKKMPTIVQIIQNYMNGNATEAEEQVLYNWLKEKPENRKILFGDKDIWEASQIGSQVLEEVEHQQWIELQQKINAQKITVKGVTEILKIAAVIIVTFGVGWLGHHIYSSNVHSNKQVEFKQIEAINGQVKEIFLADGTHVWLNSDSKLTFPSDFSEDSRKVELQGEAFFEVTSHEENPFLVKTKMHTVKVTGTKFNICEYPESKIIETTLAEGKVKIITGNFFKDLMPGQQSSFNTLTSEVKISETDFEIYTSWKDGVYEFRNESVEKIFKIMERWWDVKIDYPQDKLKYERISGVLRKHKPLEQHFQVIQQLIPVNYKITNDIIEIKLK